MKKKVLSLFSGAGGMDLGFEGNFKTFKSFLNLDSNWVKEDYGEQVLLKPTNFEIVFANDILNPAIVAWKNYFIKRGSNSTIFHQESIIDLVKKHKAGERIFPDNIDVVIGGFPCQDFSVAGNRKGFNSIKGHNGGYASESEISSFENRGQLYIWMKNVIEITKPKIFYAENVKGLTSLGEVKKIIENDFKSIDDNGYFIIPTKILNVANYGVPQNRERIIFIGLNKKFLKKEVLHKLENYSNDLISLYPESTHLANINYSTCRMAFQGLLEPEYAIDLSQKSFSKAKFIKGYQGNKEINLDGIAPTIRAEHHGNIEYRRLNIENNGKYIDELMTKIERRLTVRECARLQTFPDDYEFVFNKGKDNRVSASGAYKIIGNAVPPLFAYHLAKKLESLWDVLFED